MITLLGTSLPISAFAQPVSSSLVQEELQLACSFLKNLYNASLGLVRTTSNSSVYYIASDNLLAERALSSCDPTTSLAIVKSLSSCCDSGFDQMHEALLGVRIPLPIHAYTTITVANSSQSKLFRNITPAATGGNYTVSSGKFTVVSGYSQTAPTQTQPSTPP